MRIPGRWLRAASVSLAAAATLAACTSATPSSSPRSASPSPTPSPIFTSDADALAAAVDVYKQFLIALDGIGHDGGAHPERIKPYLGEAAYQFELAQARKYEAEHSHGVGAAVLNNAILESREERNGAATVTIFVCEDISAVDRVDANGHSLVDPDRGDYFDYEVVLTGSKPDGLVIQSDRDWSGGQICRF